MPGTSPRVESISKTATYLSFVVLFSLPSSGVDGSHPRHGRQTSRTSRLLCHPVFPRCYRRRHCCSRTMRRRMDLISLGGPHSTKGSPKIFPISFIGFSNFSMTPKLAMRPGRLQFVVLATLITFALC
ncbi:hypothetical protein F4819DRAFT_457821 [Hypoxylon fuscum]|nr:hypothetical protein F4819DRAFT_457821 [Hypoxylon fuscum]